MKTAKFAILLETKQILNSILESVSSALNCRRLREVHSLIVTLGLNQSVFLSGKLISKYAKFKDPISSLSVFYQVLPTNNAYHWNSIIRALTHSGMFSEALRHYVEMQNTELQPDTYSFPSVINACAGLQNFKMGKIVHGRILEMGFGSDLYICNALIDMYARFDDLPRAQLLFEDMPHRDIVSWNSLISGYSSHACFEEALEIYRRLRMEFLVPDSYTISSVLPACGGSLHIKAGLIIHGLVEKIGIHTDILVGNGLLSMYFKFCRLEDAQKVFDKMVVRDCVSWNIMICGYSQLELYEESIELFMQMVNGFQSDLLTVTSVLRACAHLRDLETAKYVHDYMKKSEFEFDVTANNILIDMYAKCGNLLVSREVFGTMKNKDSVSWNSLINGYFISGYYYEGLKLFKIMKASMKPDFVTYVMILSISTQLAYLNWGKLSHCDILKLGFDSHLVVSNALLDMYAKCGKVEQSLVIFENLKARDVVAWNTIISASIHYEDCNLGFRMMSRMRNEGLMPDVATMLGILPVCSQLAAKKQGKEIHGCILRLGFDSHLPVGNALIEMYSNCGNLKGSLRVFNLMKMKDVITWTSLISAFGMHGEGERALRAFAEMEGNGVLPDHLAFLAVIFACSHSGLVEDGLTCFYRMKKHYKIEPRIEHYACVVDLLSRSGLLVQAEQFINSMPFKPDASIWGALLSACRTRGDTSIASHVSEQVAQRNPYNTGYYILVSNMYAALGKWDQVRAIREIIKAKGLKKDPGSSWMAIEKKDLSSTGGVSLTT